VIKGINHLTFSVSNLDVSIDFYQRVFGAELLFRDARTAYFDIAGLWLALNVQESIPRTEIRQSYTHIAFTVDAADMVNMQQRLGVALLPDRSRGGDEGQSLYFADCLAFWRKLVSFCASRKQGRRSQLCKRKWHTLRRRHMGRSGRFCIKWTWAS